MKGRKILRICLMVLLMSALTVSSVTGEARIVEVDGQTLTVLTEEDIKEILAITEENAAMKKENTVLHETIKEYSVIHNKMVTQIYQLKEAYDSATRTRNIFVGISIALSLAALGGVLLW